MGAGLRGPRARLRRRRSPELRIGLGGAAREPRRVPARLVLAGPAGRDRSLHDRSRRRLRRHLRLLRGRLAASARAALRRLGDRRADERPLRPDAPGRIIDADIELNGWDGERWPAWASPPQHGWYFTCHPAQPRQPDGLQRPTASRTARYIDLQNTLTHEVGHFVGLRHPCGEQGLPSCTSNLPPDEVPYAERTMYPMTAAPGGRRSATSPPTTSRASARSTRTRPAGAAAAAERAAGRRRSSVAALALRPRRRAG